MAGFCNLPTGLHVTGVVLCEANFLKVSGHYLKYSRFLRATLRV
jgi:hypothetical protein